MEFNGNKSIYLQICDAICERILSGDLAPDSRIPSVREYGAEIGVNPNTVMRSYEKLTGEGIIYNRRGIGYFISEDAPKIVLESQREEFMKNEPVDVVVRPEDVDIVPVEQGALTGEITSVTFRGVHFEIIVDIGGFKWMIQTTDFAPEGAEIGLYIEPDAIHIMKKSKYSGEFGDYSSFSDEMDYISNAELDITDLDDITEVEEDE